MRLLLGARGVERRRAAPTCASTLASARRKMRVWSRRRNVALRPPCRGARASISAGSVGTCGDGVAAVVEDPRADEGHLVRVVEARRTHARHERVVRRLLLLLLVLLLLLRRLLTVHLCTVRPLRRLLTVRLCTVRLLTVRLRTVRLLRRLLRHERVERGVGAPRPRGHARAHDVDGVRGRRRARGDDVRALGELAGPRRVPLEHERVRDHLVEDGEADAQSAKRGRVDAPNERVKKAGGEHPPLPTLRVEKVRHPVQEVVQGARVRRGGVARRGEHRLVHDLHLGDEHVGRVRRVESSEVGAGGADEIVGDAEARSRDAEEDATHVLDEPRRLNEVEALPDLGGEERLVDLGARRRETRAHRVSVDERVGRVARGVESDPRVGKDGDGAARKAMPVARVDVVAAVGAGEGTRVSEGVQIVDDAVDRNAIAVQSHVAVLQAEVGHVVRRRDEAAHEHVRGGRLVHGKDRSHVVSKVRVQVRDHLAELVEERLGVVRRPGHERVDGDLPVAHGENGKTLLARHGLQRVRKKVAYRGARPPSHVAHHPHEYDPQHALAAAVGKRARHAQYCREAAQELARVRGGRARRHGARGENAHRRVFGTDHVGSSKARSTSSSTRRVSSDADRLGSVDRATDRRVHHHRRQRHMCADGSEFFLSSLHATPPHTPRKMPRKSGCSYKRVKGKCISKKRHQQMTSPKKKRGCSHGRVKGRCISKKQFDAKIRSLRKRSAKKTIARMLSARKK